MQFEKKLSIIYLVLAESNSCDARIESAVMLGEYYYTHMIKWLQSSWFYKCSWAKKLHMLNCWGNPVISVSEFTPHLITYSQPPWKNALYLLAILSLYISSCYLSHVAMSLLAMKASRRPKHHLAGLPCYGFGYLLPRSIISILKVASMPMQCQKKPSIIYLLHAEPSSCYARIESAVMLGEY